MELWIRSQDKAELINVDNLYLGQTDSTICTRYRQNQICIIILGYYTTKERALEVLDEIEDEVNYSKNIDKVLSIKPELNNTTLIQPQSFVYEMPKD